MHWKIRFKDGGPVMAFIKANILCLLLLASGCGGGKQAPHARRTQALLESFGKEMEKEFGLVFQGCGGSMPNSVDEVEVLFEAHRKGTIEEARALQIAGTEKLLQKINSEKSLKPYLKESPFPPGKVSLSISYSKDGKSRFDDGSIALAYKTGNQIFYYSYDPISNSLQSLFSESYENALK